MRKLYIILLIVPLLFQSCSYKSSLSASYIMDEISKITTFPDCTLYTELDDYTSTMLYSPNENPPSALKYCDSIAVCIYNGNRIWEIHIFRTISAYDNPNVEKMLITRRDKLQTSEIQQYDSEEYERTIAGAIVYTVDNFIFLFVTENNDRIESCVESLLK